MPSFRALFASPAFWLFLLALPALLWAVRLFSRVLIYPGSAVAMPSEGNLASAWPGVRRVTLQTSDGLSLVAAFARADSPESSPTVLYFHGNGESAAQNLPFAKALSQAGVNVFLAEYRGHGGLDGRPTEAGLLRDADAAYASLSNLGIDPNLVILDEIRAHLASGRDQRG